MLFFIIIDSCTNRFYFIKLNTVKTATSFFLVNFQGKLFIFLFLMYKNNKPTFLQKDSGNRSETGLLSFNFANSVIIVVN